MNNRELAKMWSSQNSVDYYLKHRDVDKDLYPSEKFFLETALADRKTILDFGCACGGFSKIVRKYNKDISYTGIDISPVMIREAKRRFPQDSFYVFEGKRINFPDDHFDICISFGVLHMTENWNEIINELWRVCRGLLIFDLRVVESEGICDSRISYQRLEFEGSWDGLSIAPYVVLNIRQTMDYITGLRPKPKSIKSFGYWHSVSEATVSKYKQVCMAAFCLGKNSSGEAVDWQLPIPMPEGLRIKKA